MPIYKRGSTYMVSVGSGPDRIRKSFKTLEEAEKAERLHKLVKEGVIEAPKEVPKTTLSKPLEHSLGAAYKLTLRDTWSQRRSDASVKAANSVLARLGKDTLVSTITPQVIREMVTEMEDTGNTGATINKKLSALSMMLKTAADEGWIEHLPRIKRRSSGTHRIRWLNVEEETEVLNACTHLNLPSLRDFIIVAIDTGFRKGELLGFHVADYRNGMLNLHGDQTKTAKPRSIPATDRVHALIEARRGYQKLFEDITEHSLRMHWEILRDHLGKLDDPQFVPHMLRHTCASRLAMQDKPAQFIQEWMGHSTPLTTARYMHLAPAKLREGKAALEAYRVVTPHLKVVSA
jgi:integrase